MSERPGPSQESVAIKNDPLSFRKTLEQHVKDSDLTINDIRFDVVTSETTDPDGTRHTTTKPFVIEPVENLKEEGLQILIGAGSTYVVLSGSHGGGVEDGDETIYSNTRIAKLPAGSLFEELKRPTFAWATKINLYYSHDENWVARAGHDYIDSQRSRVRLTGNDEFLEKFLALLERVEPTT